MSQRLGPIVQGECKPFAEVTIIGGVTLHHDSHFVNLTCTIFDKAITEGIRVCVTATKLYVLRS